MKHSELKRPHIAPRPLHVLCSALLCTLLTACGGSSENNPDTRAASSSAPLQVPEDFDYDMNQDITVRLQVFDHNGNPGKYIAVSISQPDKQVPLADNIPDTTRPQLISRGQTDESGYFEQSLKIPGHLQQIQLQVSQLGINNQVLLDINNPIIFHEFK